MSLTSPQVATGVAATLGLIAQTPAVYAQIAGCCIAGGSVGFYMANGLPPTSNFLPSFGSKDLHERLL